MATYITYVVFPICIAVITFLIKYIKNMTKNQQVAMLNIDEVKDYKFLLNKIRLEKTKSESTKSRRNSLGNSMLNDKILNHIFTEEERKRLDMYEERVYAFAKEGFYTTISAGYSAAEREQMKKSEKNSEEKQESGRRLSGVWSPFKEAKLINNIKKEVTESPEPEAEVEVESNESQKSFSTKIVECIKGESTLLKKRTSLVGVGAWSEFDASF